MNLSIICDTGFNDKALIYTKINNLRAEYNITSIYINKYAMLNPMVRLYNDALIEGIRLSPIITKMGTHFIVGERLVPMNNMDILLVFYGDGSASINLIIKYAREHNKILYIVKYKKLELYKTI